MVRPALKDKDAFKRLQSAGLLGNYFRMWDTVQGVRDAGYTGWLTVRARRASDRALFIPAILSEAVMQQDDWLLVRLDTPFWEQPRSIADVYLQEIPAPDTGRVINLEAMWGCSADARMHVRYALNDPTNLRHSLEQNGVDVTGLKAWAVLRHYLGPDMDQLTDIWDRWPGAIIEASKFTKRLGVFDSRTIIWEAREF